MNKAGGSMKPKKIVIAYLKIGDIKSIVAKEFLFNELTNEMVKEGREIVSASFSRVSFSDGSKIYTTPFGRELKDLKATHIYIDKSININSDIVYKLTKPVLMTGGYYSNVYDLDGDRIFTYHLEGDKVKKEVFQQE